jgi:hypothetical protein
MTARKTILNPRMTIRVRQFFTVDDHDGQTVPFCYGYAAILMPAGGNWVRVYGPYPTKKEAKAKAMTAAVAEKAVVVE